MQALKRGKGKTRVTAGKGTRHHVQCKSTERVAGGRAAIRSRLESEPVDEVDRLRSDGAVGLDRERGELSELITGPLVVLGVLGASTLFGKRAL